VQTKHLNRILGTIKQEKDGTQKYKKQRQITEIRNIKNTKMVIKKRMGYFYYSVHIYCSCNHGIIYYVNRILGTIKQEKR